MNFDVLEMGIRFVLANGTWFALGVIALIVTACLPNAYERPWRERERRTLRECRVMTNRILGFLPTYEAEVERYATWIGQQVQSQKVLMKLGDQLPVEAKAAAERQFCLHDADHMEAITILQMEMNQLLRKQQEV